MLKIGMDEHTQFRIEDPISHYLKVIDCNDNTQVIRYLGASLAMKKFQK
jgi:hypothetical protein